MVSREDYHKGSVRVQTAGLRVWSTFNASDEDTQEAMAGVLGFLGQTPGKSVGRQKIYKELSKRWVDTMMRLSLLFCVEQGLVDEGQDKRGHWVYSLTEAGEEWFRARRKQTT